MSGRMMRVLSDNHQAPCSGSVGIASKETNDDTNDKHDREKEHPARYISGKANETLLPSKREQGKSANQCQSNKPKSQYQAQYGHYDHANEEGGFVGVHCRNAPNGYRTPLLFPLKFIQTPFTAMGN